MTNKTTLKYINSLALLACIDYILHNDPSDRDLLLRLVAGDQLWPFMRKICNDILRTRTLMSNL